MFRGFSCSLNVLTTLVQTKKQFYMVLLNTKIKFLEICDKNKLFVLIDILEKSNFYS